LVYRAAWSTPAEDEDALDLPAWLEPLFLAVLTAVARGLDEEDVASAELRFESVRSSRLWADAEARDGGVQADVGVIENGAAQRLRPSVSFTGPIGLPG